MSPSLLWQLKGDLTHVESLNSAPLSPAHTHPPPLSHPFVLLPRSSHIRHYTLCRVHTATTTPVSPSLLWQLKGDLTHVRSLNSAPSPPTHPPRPTPYTPFRPRSSFLPYSSSHTVSCTHCNYHTGVTKPSLTTKKRSYTCRVAQFRPLAPRPYPPSTPYTPFRPRSLFLPYSSFHTVSCAHCNYPSPCAQWHHHMVIFT